MAKPLCLGVELGGTKLQVGLGPGDGTIKALRQARVAPQAGAAALLEQAAEEADRACWELGLTREAIEAVGFGFGGPVEASRGVVRTSHHVPGWDDFPLADWAARQFAVEPGAVAVENDADTAAFAEARFGAGRGSSPLLYVTVGSGVGGGVIRDGRIDRGAGVGASEIGHLWFAFPNEDGSGGETVEQAASGWSIARQAKASAASDPTGAATLLDLVDGRAEEITAEVVAMAADLGDAASQAILALAARALAAGLAQAATILGPKRIILGGGVSQIGEARWLRPIREHLNRLVFPGFRGTFDLVASKLGAPVVVHGALALARDILSINCR